MRKYFSVFFRVFPWRARLSPGVQIPDQKSRLLLGKCGRVQKENPRASAFVSGCWEGRERGGRSSLVEAKDPIFTLAAVVELE